MEFNLFEVNMDPLACCVLIDQTYNTVPVYPGDREDQLYAIVCVYLGELIAAAGLLFNLDDTMRL